MSNDQLQTALFYKNSCGLDVIPDHPTAKYPKGIEGWQEKEFSIEDLAKWIGKEGWGIGIRNQEGLDFDNKGNPPADELFSQWQEMVEAQCPGLVSRLTIETTPSGGYHVVYKCPTIEGNQKLATRPATPEEKAADPKKTEITLIETRGLGGQFMVAPSPGYEVIQGGWANLREITPEEREILFDCARALHIPKEKPKGENGKTPTIEGDRPGDIYNQQHTNEALELLQRVGWAAVYTKNETTYLRRPGKKQGVSATFNYLGSNVLYVFSSNASPFDMQQSYSPFAIYTTLEHGGDFNAAAQSLASRFSLNGDNKKTSIDNHQYEAESMPDEPRTDQTFKRLSLAELIRQPAKNWLIEGFIGQQDLIMIYGESGTGKTFAAVDLIYCAILGRKFADKFDIDRPLSVAYCASEGIGGLPQRFLAGANHYGADPNHADNFSSFLDVPQLFDQKAITSVYTFVNDWKDSAWGKLDLLIIDTLHGATWGADENQSKDAGLILRAMKYARDALNCSVGLIHHANRQGTYRGSSALHGAMDSMFQTKMVSDSIFSLECFKQKDFERFAPLYFKLTPEHYSQSAYTEWLDKVTIELDDPTPKGARVKDDILSLLTDKPGLNQSAIVASLPGYNRKTVLKALDELEAGSGIISFVGQRNSKVYDLSSNGQLDRTTDNSPI